MSFLKLNLSQHQLIKHKILTIKLTLPGVCGFAIHGTYTKSIFLHPLELQWLPLITHNILVCPDNCHYLILKCYNFSQTSIFVQDPAPSMFIISIATEKSSLISRDTKKACTLLHTHSFSKLSCKFLYYLIVPKLNRYLMQKHLRIAITCL